MTEVRRKNPKSPPWPLLVCLAIAVLMAAFVARPAQSSQSPVASEFQIVIDSASHLKYGLYYPVTYMFTIAGGSSGLVAQYRYSATDAWTSLPTMTSADFFNGIAAARFDYPNNMAYISVPFSNISDAIYVRLLNGQSEVPIAYSGIPLYYDNRRSAVTVSLDDWDWAAASQILTNDHIHYTIAIWSNFNPDWPTIQYWYNQGYLEPGGHTRDHPCTDAAYVSDGGYDYEIAGVRDDILSHLTLRQPYVPAFILPCGFESPLVRQAITRANYIGERGASFGGNAYSPWGTDGAYTLMNFTYTTFDWAGTQTAARRDAGNAYFDSTYNSGGIYSLTDHPADGYWVAGSYLAQHIDYIANRKDVWYGAFGELYLYHFVQERGMVTVSPASAPLPTFTPTFTPTPAPEVLDPANVSTLPAGTNVLLDFNNFPAPTNGLPIPANFAGLTWNQLVEGPPWGGIQTWNFYITAGQLSGTIAFPRPVTIKSLRVSSSLNNTITLSSPQNADASITTAPNVPQTLTVTWNFPVTSLTIRSSTGDQALDDLRFIVLDQAPTSTPTPISTATATPAFTNTPTPAGAPTSTSTPAFTSTPTSTPLPSPTPTATPLPSPTPTATPANTPTPLPDLIFADGFETGDMSRWSTSATDGGHLSVSATAALTGTYGLQSVIADNKAAYVQDNSPAAESRYRARFYFAPNSIAMSSGNAHYILYGYAGTSTVVLRVEFGRSGTGYQLRAGLIDNATTWLNTSWFAITDAPHSVELDWSAATAAGANNGFLTLWIDGVGQANLTGVNNDTRRIDMVRLGPVAGMDSGTRGTYYFDAFESRRYSYIGK